MSDDAYAEVRRGLARRHGLPESAASRIKGDTLEAMAADAMALADAVGAQPPGSANPNAGELAALFAAGDKQQATARFIEWLHGSPDPQPDPDRKVDFDAGVRESAVAEPDPQASFNQVTAAVARGDDLT